MTADNHWSMETEIAPRRRRLDQIGAESDELGVIAWRGLDNVMRGVIIGTMIRHAFCS